MSFWVAQIISVAGVAAVIALTWAVGWGRAEKLASLDAAAARFRVDFPAAEVKGGALGKDGRAAVLDLGDGFGLVTVLGDEFVTRMLRAEDIAAKSGENELVFTLPDPTLPRVRLALEPDDAAQWLARVTKVWS
jgi:hypothetical protein